MEVQTPPRVVNPLTVAIKDGKKRLVLDLRYVNKAVLQQKCKIEAAETLAQYLPSSKFLYGFDSSPPVSRRHSICTHKAYANANRQRHAMGHLYTSK